MDAPRCRATSRGLLDLLRDADLTAEGGRELRVSSEA